LALALAVCLVEPCQAQEESGRIIGRVVTQGGSPAAGVRVVAEARDGPGTRQESTDASGYFRLPGLLVGSYRLRIAFVGYRPVVVDSVLVRLGRTTTIGVVSLESQAFELGELVVRAEQALIDVTSAATATNLTSEQFENIPTDRNFRSIVSLAPQANSSFLPEDEVNIAGATGPENAYFLDGVDISDPFRGVTSSNLPYNFVREIQAKAGGYEAEYGRATGGIVNVITHTGSNRFSGQIFGFYTGNGLSASPKFALAGAEESQFSIYDFGGSLGGPIVKDHLWFFAAYNPSFKRQRVEAPGVELPDETLTQHLFATKLNWWAGPRTDVTFTLNGDPSTHRHLDLAGVPGSLLNAEAITQEGRQGGAVFSGLVRHQLGSRSQLQLEASRYTHKDNSDPPTEFGLTAPHFLDASTGELSGGAGILFHSEADRRALRGSVTVGWHDHDLKAGVEYEDNRFEQLNDQTAAPGSPGGGITRFDDTTYIWTRVLVRGAVRNRVPTIYAQDSWRVRDRLTLNLGLRWDGQYLRANGATVQSFTNQWQPRLGAIYQLGTKGEHKIFGSFGRFYEQLTLNMAILYYNADVNVTVLHFNHDPRADPTGGDTLFSLFNPQVQPRRDLNGQNFDEFTLGYEGAVGAHLRAGVRGIVRRLRWAVEDAFNADSGEYQMGNPGRGNLGFVPPARRHYSALVFTLEKPAGRLNFLASYTLSRTSGNYQGLYDYRRDFVPAFPNTTTDFDFPEQYPNSSGLLPNDRTHMVKLAGSYRVNGNLTVGTFVSWGSGTPRDELGATPIGNGIYAYLQPRGSVGRNPSLFDINLRLTYVLPAWGMGVRPKLLLDLFHLTNARTTLRNDDVHFLALDANGNQTLVNPNYNQPRSFAPPMSARLGITVDFGKAP
jgi:hypothetical protein